MPIFEYECSRCLNTRERFVHGNPEDFQAPVCEICNTKMERKEFSIPAKRNPEHGIVK